MKRFWYKFLVCVLSLGMLYPTWIATGTQKAKAANFSHEYYYGESSTSYLEKTPASWHNSSFLSGGRWTQIPGEYAIWKFTPEVTGEYRVSVNWVIGSNQSDEVLYYVKDQSGENPPISVSQKVDQDGSDQPDNTVSDYKLLGTYYFNALTEYQVKITGDIDASNHLFAGYVKISHENVKPEKPEIINPSDTEYINTKTPELDWTPSLDTDDIALEYELILDDNSDFSSPQIDLSGSSILSDDFYDVTLSDGLGEGNYYWSVRAWDGTDYSEYSNINSFIIDTISPSTKPDLSAPVIKNGVVNLSWSAAEDNLAGSGIAYYEIFRESSPAQLIGTTTKTTFSDAPGYGIFKYFVRAYDNAGNYVDSDPTVEIDLSQLPAPANFTVVLKDGEALLFWDAVGGATSYNVYYKKTTQAAWIGPVNVDSNSTKVTGLESGVGYDFLVRAVSASGIGGDAIVSIAPKTSVVLASAPTVQDAVVAQPETPVVTPEVTPPTEETGPEVGQIKGEETVATEEEDINWTPWIILFVLIVLAGAATGGYFYWFGNEEEEIVSEKVIEKTRKSNGKKSSSSKPSAKKSKRW